MCVSTSVMRVLSASIALTLPLGAASAAEYDATLSRLEGVGVVSQGAQYVPAHEGMALREGDRFMVLEGGNAVVTFADGCRYPLADNEVLTVGATNTCAAGTAGSYKVAPYSAVAGDPSAAASVHLARAIGAGPPKALNIPSWAIPAGVVGTLGVLGATLPTGSDDGNGGGNAGLVVGTPSP
jgi:hypothetical protein